MRSRASLTELGLLREVVGILLGTVNVELRFELVKVVL
jgi:hypothetical protein